MANDYAIRNSPCAWFPEVSARFPLFVASQFLRDDNVTPSTVDPRPPKHDFRHPTSSSKQLYLFSLFVIFPFAPDFSWAGTLTEVVATLMGIPGWNPPVSESGTAWDSLRCDQTWLAREIPKVNGHLNWNITNITYQWEIFHYPITRKHDDKHWADYQNNDIHPQFQWIDKFLLSRL